MDMESTLQPHPNPYHFAELILLISLTSRSQGSVLELLYQHSLLRQFHLYRQFPNVCNLDHSLNFRFICSTADLTSLLVCLLDISKTQAVWKRIPELSPEICSAHSLHISANDISILPFLKPKTMESSLTTLFSHSTSNPSANIVGSKHIQLESHKYKMPAYFYIQK